MTCSRSFPYAVAAVLLSSVANAAALDAKAEYELRSAQRYVGLFQALDRNKDGTVTREEARGDLVFAPRFDDMDINRDGIVTAAELERFVQQYFGVQANVAAPATQESGGQQTTAAPPANVAPR